MLCFVMALKSKRVSKDWPRVCRLFEASLLSAYQQTDPDIRVIVVCHETPDVRGKYDKRFEVINVDFPVPEQLTTPLCMKDKWTKIQIGLIRAGELKPRFIMLMDADDLVSNRIAAHAAAHGDANGWVLTTGYNYAFGSRWIAKDDDYNCGTNAIVSSRLIRFPTDASPAGREQCSILRWGHTIIAQKLAEAGTPLAPLPFRGAVYVHSHGDNDSHFGLQLFGNLRARIKAMPNKRWCSRRLRDEFALDALLP